MRAQLVKRSAAQKSQRQQTLIFVQQSHVVPFSLFSNHNCNRTRHNRSCYRRNIQGTRSNGNIHSSYNHIRYNRTNRSMIGAFSVRGSCT